MNGLPCQAVLLGQMRRKRGVIVWVRFEREGEVVGVGDIVLGERIEEITVRRRYCIRLRLKGRAKSEWREQNEKSKGMEQDR